MTYTLLFDLDDTLLDTNIESFIPAYYQALSKHLEPYVSSEVMLPALLSGTNLMMESDDPSRTLKDVFDERFYEKLGIPKRDLLNEIEDFYDKEFPKLRGTTNSRPDAAPLIEWAIAQGYQIAIATDPLFPRKATYHRLRWAGFDPEQFELVSSFEKFHFTKTHAAYYAEMLGQLGWQDGPVLMIGNDMKRDIIPADRFGLKTYFIDNGSASSSGPEAGRGKLADLRPWLESQNPFALEPSFKSPEAIMAILSSTPAVLSSLSQPLTEEQWRCEPTPDDWAVNEIVCHLRDTDLEVHAEQLQRMVEKDDAFIRRPDSSIWANEREYLNVHGPSALTEFTAARIQIVKTLKGLDSSMWQRKARHAIFGPTNFIEVMGFATEHDRSHVQQMWRTLQNVQAERV
ncbi:MAG TPA: DinB family protein [Anaerolineales bacterium]|nr:DinB family protein [Anaerolineales bacterium]